MNELKPCPFCGGKAVLRAVKDGNPWDYFKVGCDEMRGYCRGNINGSPLYPSEDSAVEWWNKRKDGENDG